MSIELFTQEDFLRQVKKEPQSMREEIAKYYGDLRSFAESIEKDSDDIFWENMSLYFWEMYQGELHFMICNYFEEAKKFFDEEQDD